jgi:hypothetical protein
MSRRRFIILNIVLLLTACAPAGPRATELLPTVTTAQTVEGKLADFLRSSKEGLVMLRTHPAETDLIDLIDRAQSCYQQIEGVATRAYSDNRLPLMAGIAVITDRAATDQGQLDRCLALSQQTFPAKPTFELCSQAYTTTLGSREFYLAYMALSPNMCQILCDHLSNCVTPP